MQGEESTTCEIAETRCFQPVAVGVEYGSQVKRFLKTKHGAIYRGDSLDHMEGLPDSSVDLIITSPPFGLVRTGEGGVAHGKAGWREEWAC